jgi:hypothetical protein
VVAFKVCILARVLTMRFDTFAAVETLRVDIFAENKLASVVTRKFTRFAEPDTLIVPIFAVTIFDVVTLAVRMFADTTLS